MPTSSSTDGFRFQVPVPGSGSRFERGTPNRNWNRNFGTTGNTVALSASHAGFCPLSTDGFVITVASVAVLLLINGRADAQGIGFQGGVDRRSGTGVCRHPFRDGRAVSELSLQAWHRRRVRRRLFAGDAQHRVPVSHPDRPLVERVSGWRAGRGVRAPERSNEHARRLVLHVRLRARKRLLHRLQARIWQRRPTLKFGVGFTVRKKAP